MTRRLRDVLVVVLALFVFGASAQAAVCELACGPQVIAMQCNSAAGHSEAMVMSGGHCSHAMASTQHTQSASGLPAESCGHAAAPVLDKGGSSVVPFTAVHWVSVGMVPVDLVLTGADVGAVRRPPLVPVGVDPLVAGLRV